MLLGTINTTTIRILTSSTTTFIVTIIIIPFIPFFCGVAHVVVKFHFWWKSTMPANKGSQLVSIESWQQSTICLNVRLPQCPGIFLHCLKSQCCETTHGAYTVYTSINCIHTALYTLDPTMKQPFPPVPIIPPLHKCSLSQNWTFERETNDALTNLNVNPWLFMSENAGWTKLIIKCQ